MTLAASGTIAHAKQCLTKCLKMITYTGPAKHAKDKNSSFLDQNRFSHLEELEACDTIDRNFCLLGMLTSDVQSRNFTTRYIHVHVICKCNMQACSISESGSFIEYVFQGY